MAAPETGWIGVDLDGTLARHDVWRGPEFVGAPIPAMVDRVRAWLAGGYEVRIVTARVCSMVEEADRQRIVDAISRWCLIHLGRVIPVQAEKDYHMLELWDDRAVRVAFNKGRRVSPSELPTEDAAIETEVDDPTPPPIGPDGALAMPPHPPSAKIAEPTCSRCGRPRSNHKVRHPFEGISK